MNVTAVPALVVDMKKELLVTVFAKTVVGNESTIEPFLNCIGVEPTPTNVDCGLYTNCSFSLKKWLLIVNLPEDKLTLVVSVGLNVFP